MTLIRTSTALWRAIVSTTVLVTAFQMCVEGISFSEFHKFTHEGPTDGKTTGFVDDDMTTGKESSQYRELSRQILHFINRASEDRQSSENLQRTTASTVSINWSTSPGEKLEEHSFSSLEAVNIHSVTENGGTSDIVSLDEISSYETTLNDFHRSDTQSNKNIHLTTVTTLASINWPATLGASLEDQGFSNLVNVNTHSVTVNGGTSDIVSLDEISSSETTQIDFHRSDTQSNENIHLTAITNLTATNAPVTLGVSLEDQGFSSLEDVNIHSVTENGGNSEIVTLDEISSYESRHFDFHRADTRFNENINLTAITNLKSTNSPVTLGASLEDQGFSSLEDVNTHSVTENGGTSKIVSLGKISSYETTQIDFHRSDTQPNENIHLTTVTNLTSTNSPSILDTETILGASLEDQGFSSLEDVNTHSVTENGGTSEIVSLDEISSYETTQNDFHRSDTQSNENIHLTTVTILTSTKSPAALESDCCECKMASADESNFIALVAAEFAIFDEL